VNKVINKTVEFIDLGQKDYKETWDFQEDLFAKSVALKIENRKANPEEQKPTPNYLIFVEHPHVYTLGKSGNPSHLLLNEQELEDKEAVYYKINRGGDITYHGPGQLVGYPIFDLENFFTDIHLYLRNLEEAIILTLEEFGINAGRISGLTGVWIQNEDGSRPRKICAMGVKSSRWITMHGFALNINANIDYFNNIVPCGIPDKEVTSMHLELGRHIEESEVKEKVKKHLQTLFQLKFI
jgi:lipoyl(octanoyl) transferase